MQRAPHFLWLAWSSRGISNAPCDHAGNQLDPRDLLGVETPPIIRRCSLRQVSGDDFRRMFRLLRPGLPSGKVTRYPKLNWLGNALFCVK